MENSERIYIDLSRADSRETLYTEIYTKLRQTEDCGYNLDALWDVLTGMELPGDDFALLRGDCADERFGEYVERVCTVFRLAAAEYDDFTVTVFRAVTGE